MKRILLLLLFILIFLFFPFPKNIGSQNEESLNLARDTAKTQMQTLTSSSFSFLPESSEWPRPFRLIWEAIHLDQTAHSLVKPEHWYTLAEMPSELPQAIISIEDHRFYSHSGVDLDGILRAMLANIQADDIVQGGSTLTQQVIKNLLLTHEQTMERKIWEVFLALIVESQFSKDEILTIYLNTTYLGAGSTGVGQAADIYFGKNATDLNLAECATLAALPYAPSALNPFDNPEGCQKRRNLVLKKMLKRGIITTKTAEDIYDIPIILRNI
ncbi:MAG TPA: transglycosylase domain-containing protein [Candidatus Avacidaminococcus intestinavium]|uniref:Transglycosylase domain-containing protein n=1 Tax=Candidatus Avacidaminococcus intestinavium TaxID=2840684 RepID=A0A9D1MPA6_9FIRM|nr:transglycosylase domain-containing protein [Candidatus Avacidaminococcus intestinavium]